MGLKAKQADKVKKHKKEMEFDEDAYLGYLLEKSGYINKEKNKNIIKLNIVLVVITLLLALFSYCIVYQSIRGDTNDAEIYSNNAMKASYSNNVKGEQKESVPHKD